MLLFFLDETEWDLDLVDNSVLILDEIEWDIDLIENLVLILDENKIVFASKREFISDLR
ncbi:hypothetical protein K0H71_02225 [Bacillus sp. IITD106]|nr:hypothetical protein [Bacillus sp. IITD106]